MAVYKRTWRAYTGPLTPPALRFLVLRRYALRAVFRSRFLLVGYLACFIGPLLALCALYLNQNAALLNVVRAKPGVLAVNASWFMNFLVFQGLLAGLLTAFVGPSLVAPDLANGALSVYLSRPLSRAEYILGKGSVLAGLIASITLVPLLLCFVVQSSLVGYAWFSANIYIAGAIVLGSFFLIAVLVLLGLAMSAWVRWRIVAGALILASFAAGKGFGAVVNGVMRTTNGYFLDIQYLLARVTGSLFRNVDPDAAMSGTAAGLALILFCALLVLLIDRKLRVCEAA